MFYRFLFLALFIVLLASCSSESNVDYKAAEKGVVFIWPCGPSVQSSEQLRNLVFNNFPNGVGFILSINAIRKADRQKTTLYTIATCQHLLADSLVFRFNQESDRSFTFKLDHAGKNAVTIPDGTSDLALLLIPKDISEVIKKKDVFTTDMICGSKKFRSLNISEGTKVYSVGYLRKLHFLEKNLVVFRFGRMARILDKPWVPVRQTKQRAHLVDISGGRGMSGAPVLLDRPGEERILGIWKMNVSSGVVDIPNSRITGSVNQGISLIEPGESLEQLLRTFYSRLKDTYMFPDSSV